MLLRGHTLTSYFLLIIKLGAVLVCYANRSVQCDLFNNVQCYRLRVQIILYGPARITGVSLYSRQGKPCCFVMLRIIFRYATDVT